MIFKAGLEVEDFGLWIEFWLGIFSLPQFKLFEWGRGGGRLVTNN